MILLPPRSTFFPYTTLFRSGHTVEFYCHSAAEVDAADDDTHSWRAYAGREIINDRRRANYDEVVGRGRAPGCGLNRDRAVGRAGGHRRLDLGHCGDRKRRGLVVEQEVGRADEVEPIDGHRGVRRAAQG